MLNGRFHLKSDDLGNLSDDEWTCVQNWKRLTGAGELDFILCKSAAKILQKISEEGASLAETTKHEELKLSYTLMSSIVYLLAQCRLFKKHPGKQKCRVTAPQIVYALDEFKSILEYALKDPRYAEMLRRMTIGAAAISRAIARYVQTRN